VDRLTALQSTLLHIWHIPLLFSSLPGE